MTPASHQAIFLQPHHEGDPVHGSTRSTSSGSPRTESERRHDIAQRSSGHRQRGFTLLEVLIALAVVALALTALLRAASLGATALDRERQLSLATWTAQNVLASTRLRGGLPAVGRSAGDERQGPFQFHWTLTVSSTDEPGMRRADVQVFSGVDNRDPVTTLSGFLGDSRS